MLAVIKCRLVRLTVHFSSHRNCLGSASKSRARAVGPTAGFAASPSYQVGRGGTHERSERQAIVRAAASSPTPFSSAQRRSVSSGNHPMAPVHRFAETHTIWLTCGKRKPLIASPTPYLITVLRANAAFLVFAQVRTPFDASSALALSNTSFLSTYEQCQPRAFSPQRIPVHSG